MDPKALRYVGTLVRTHGIRGGLVLLWAPQAPQVDWRAGMRVYIGYSAASAQPHLVRRFRLRPRGAILELEHVTTLAHAEQFVEQGVFVEEESLAPEEASEQGWAVEDIVGCLVIEEGSRQKLGPVVDVWLLPANDVWVVELPNAYLPLPVIPDVVQRVDLHRRRIWVRLLPGLLEIAEPRRSNEQPGFSEDGIDAD